MYSPTLVILLISSLFATSLGSPIPVDIFEGYVKDAQLNAPSKEGEVVKRNIYEGNPDASLKQISLQSLIGDLEDSLFNTAQSVSSVAQNGDVEVPEVTTVPEPLSSISEHDNAKRQTESTDTGTESSVDATKILLQTTKKVPEANGVPAHVLIDRISVQPNAGGVPLIPTFQVQHTKLISATITDKDTGASNPSQITVTKTVIKGIGSADVPSSSSTTEKPTAEKAQDSATTSVSGEINGTIKSAQLSINPTTDSSTPSPATTTTPIKQLKAQEEDLKEKVAEIEAEPVILSARV